MSLKQHPLSKGGTKPRSDRLQKRGVESYSGGFPRDDRVQDVQKLVKSCKN